MRVSQRSESNGLDFPVVTTAMCSPRTQKGAAPPMLARVRLRARSASARVLWSFGGRPLTGRLQLALLWSITDPCPAQHSNLCPSSPMASGTAFQPQVVLFAGITFSWSEEADVERPSALLGQIAGSHGCCYS